MIYQLLLFLGPEIADDVISFLLPAKPDRKKMLMYIRNSPKCIICGYIRHLNDERWCCRKCNEHITRLSNDWSVK